METNKGTADIVGNLTAMAQQLGVHVVAEGIENKEQLTLLRSLRCESAQGYLFAKPLSVTKAADLIRTGLPTPGGIAPHQEVASSPRLEAGLQDEKHAEPVFQTARRFSIAAAIALLMSAGLVGGWADDAPPAVGSVSPLPSFIAVEGPANSGTPTQTPTVTPGVAAATAKPAAITAPTAPTASTAPAAPTAITGSPAPTVVARAAAAAPAVTASTAQDARPAESPEPTFLNVVHLHRMGSCAGRLVVSADGVTFVPDQESGDRFVFKHNEFLHTLADDRLTIRSNTRTYRFQEATVDGKDANALQLQQVVASIARFRE